MTAVRYEKQGHVAYITLNRPEVLNAMDERMHEDLALVWDEGEGDDDVWVAVLAGAGHRAFSVGQDLAELADRIGQGTAGTATFGSRGKPGWPRLTERFELAKPVVAKVRGYALGGGLSWRWRATSSSLMRMRRLRCRRPGWVWWRGRVVCSG
jgi:dehydration protein DpgD